MTPEQEARAEIDRLILAACRHVCDGKQADTHASCGVAIREFELAAGHGTADYPLYVDGRAASVIEAKRRGTPLIGVGSQSGSYARGLPTTLPAWQRPLTFLYEPTGVETRFTSGVDPESRAPAFLLSSSQEHCVWGIVARTWTHGCRRLNSTMFNERLRCAVNRVLSN